MSQLLETYSPPSPYFRSLYPFLYDPPLDPVPSLFIPTDTSSHSPDSILHFILGDNSIGRPVDHPFIPRYSNHGLAFVPDRSDSYPATLSRALYRQTYRDHPYTKLLCLHCGTIHKVPQYCRRRLCPVCSRRRAHQVEDRLDQFWSKKSTPPAYDLKMLTLTLRSETQPGTMARHLIDHFSRFRRRKEFRDHVQGGAYVLEITGSPSNWHVHLHALILARYWPYDRIRDLWFAQTGATGVWINRCTSSPGHYLTKYLTKAEDPSLLNHLKFLSTALANFRLFQPWGSFFGHIPKAPPSSARCPACKTDHTLVLMDELLNFESWAAARRASGKTSGVWRSRNGGLWRFRVPPSGSPPAVSSNIPGPTSRPPRLTKGVRS